MRIPSAFNRHYLTVGHLFFFILFFFSIFYYKERTLYIDNAFQFFQIINNQTLIFSENRYATMLPQILPLIAIKLHLSLKHVLVIFSLSYWLLFYSIFMLIAYKLKNIAGAIVIVLSLSLCVRHNYFYTVAEAHQGIIYSILFFSWVTRNAEVFQIKNKFFEGLISTLLILLCYFSHPLTSLLLFFIIFFRIVDTKFKINTVHYILISFLLIIYGVKVLITGTNTYDGNYFHQLTKTFSLFHDFFSLPAIIHLKDHFGMYFYPTMIFVYCFIFYLFSKSYLKAIFILVANLAFISITAIIYNMGDSYMMMEKALLPFAVFVGIPFAYDILIQDKKKFWLKMFLFVFILGYNIKYIYKSSKTYSTRVHNIANACAFTKTYQGKKFIIERKNIPVTYIDVSWAFACETLLFTSLENPDSARTVYIVERENISDINIDNPNLFLCAPFWRDWDIHNLNKIYFNLPIENYQLIQGKIE